ncbi:YggT family protein [Clostridium sp. Cult1]|uniref:YggT family protein n=1 Tax=Clostridium sp. Cult1 TaxID=2079002 RepID=UPI001F24A817|nr:YggT family protein [Clostridium sp. Cult1]MCF6462717.1 YggT family protein [Clostridium sp. Cult1]
MITLYRALSILFNIIEVLILVRIILSFLRIGPYNPIGRIVYELTEPILAPARELIYKIGIDTGMFDFSPIVAVLILRLILGIIRRVILF